MYELEWCVIEALLCLTLLAEEFCGLLLAGCTDPFLSLLIEAVVLSR